MDELAKIVASLAAESKENREWRLGFYSNGSGRPPGFFQMRVAMDDQRHDVLDKRTTSIEHEIKIISGHVATLLSRDDLAVLRRRRWVSLLKNYVMPFMLLLLTGFGWVVKKTAPVGMEIWREYLIHHPSVDRAAQDATAIPTAP